MRTFLVFSSLFLAAVSVSAQQNFTLSGIVRDSVSGEVIIGATIRLMDDSVSASKPVRGTYTNKFGFFSLPKILPKSYRLTVGYFGYHTIMKKIMADQFDTLTQLSIALSRKEIVTEEVVVTSQRSDNNSPADNISTVTIQGDFIKDMPALLGETDIFRVLQLLPGVKSPSELSSGLYVRGGSPDQNLILLDGVTIYNPAHLGGFLSTFNVDAMREVKLIKGGFPSEFGGRLSSVLDLTMKDGTKEKITGQGGISLIASRLTVEGPINDKMTFMVSGRRMYLDVLASLFLPEEELEQTPSYYFYDLNAKFTYQLSEKDKLFASGFFGSDVLSSPQNNNDASFDIVWGNASLHTKWMHIFSPDVFSNFSFIYTNYRFGSEFLDDVQSNFSFYTRSRIRDFTLKSDVTYYSDASQTIKCGIEATRHEFLSEVSADFNNGELQPVSQMISAFDAALYVQDEWYITDELFTNIGGRIYYFQSGNYLRFEPRLQATYQVAPKTKLIGSFAVANQFLHLIIRNDVNLPTDLWFPSTKTILPSYSTQGILGIETLFGDNNSYLFSIEGYYKDMRNLYEYRDTASFSLLLPLESQFTQGRGEAYGVEVFLNKRLGDFTGWVGYTLSWTRRFFDELNNGNPFWARYDRRHDVSATFSYRLSSSLEFGAAWTFGTGFAYTMPVGQYVLQPSDDRYNSSRERYLYTERNGYRLPPYHRLDLNFAFKTEVFGLPSQLVLSIYNAYNRQNPFAQFVDKEYQSDGTFKPVLKQYTLFPILPVLAWNFTF
ncbi:MAG TPA: TonB-dependent receptor plug domain-containing protein [Candidatus Kapabacteria bacterium]|nr:TonB-dependent receptor plug domain-containing protein [Candidatus Kapabacteria bacterium]